MPRDFAILSVREQTIQQLPLILFFLANICLGQDRGEIYYIFKKLPIKKHGVIVKFTDHAKINVGTLLQATSSKQIKCNLKVIKIKANLALVATDICPFEEELQLNQPLTRINQQVFSDNNQLLHPYIFKKLESDELISIKLPTNSKVKEGTILIATQFERRGCIIKVMRIYDQYAIGETSNCPFRAELKVNQPLLPLETSNPQKKDLGDLIVNPPKKIIKPGFDKKWYTYWSLGYGTTSLDGPEIGTTMAGENHSVFTFDLLGFYFPFRKTNLLMGGVINTIWDTFEYTPTGGSKYSTRYFHLLPAFSSIYFLGPSAGRQWFVRGDLGFAKSILSSNGTNSSSSLGIGFLLGGGHAWDLSYRNIQFNLLASGYYTHREISVENNGLSVDSFTLSVGILY